MRRLHWFWCMRRHSRILHLIKWLGMFLSCAILGIGIVSIFANMEVTGRVLMAPASDNLTPFVSVWAGNMLVGRADRLVKWYAQPSRPPGFRFIWRPVRGGQTVWRAGTGKPPVSNRLFMIPLWILLVMAALPTAYLFWRGGRRIPPGHCPICGYNLTGNMSGVCPECGEPHSTAAHLR